MRIDNNGKSYIPVFLSDMLFFLLLGYCVAPLELMDFDFAVETLRLRHQGCYNYVNKKETDIEIASLRNSIGEPLTKLEFYQIIRKLVGLMNEGHGSVSLPRWTMIKAGLSKSFLPLGVRFFNKELIITQNFGDNVEGLSKGAKLVSINGESISEILKKLLPLIATDGFIRTSKYEWIGGVNFSLLYSLVYGKSKEFELEIIDPLQKQTKLIRIPAIRFTKFKSKNAQFEPKYFSHYKYHFELINDSIAYLSIPKFRKDAIDYQQFYENSFKAIDSLGIKHLIIDIQRNGGGEEGNENLLFSYLMEERIQKYKRVTMLPPAYEKNKNDRSFQLDKWILKDTIAERGVFTCYSDYFSDLGYALPKKDYIYKNKLYVLISGYTFSGGAEFASMIKMTNRGLFIGEETGGAFEGNVSGYSETVKLPNTKIKINIPTVHFQINVSLKNRGRGIVPDFHVPQTWEDYMGNKNTKLEFTKELIMN
jgi:hypothetical protein